jgi:cytochrome o ubiquinol oxidase subunit 3
MKEHAHNERNERSIFAFWIYLMTDLIMFAALFAAYAVLRDGTFGGPGGRELFDLPGALTETLILLTSSFTCGLAMIAVHRGKINQAMTGLGVTLILGITFLWRELGEFSGLIARGNGPQRNAFLSSFFTLVGTHGLHIAVGLLWMIVAIIQIKVRGTTPFITSKLDRLALFWHFLDIVWIFIFTIVYLMSHA